MNRMGVQILEVSLARRKALQRRICSLQGLGYCYCLGAGDTKNPPNSMFSYRPQEVPDYHRQILSMGTSSREM